MHIRRAALSKGMKSTSHRTKCNLTSIPYLFLLNAAMPLAGRVCGTPQGKTNLGEMVDATWNHRKACAVLEELVLAALVSNASAELWDQGEAA